MKNIVLARVDDRLVHAEVLAVWVPNLKANRIIVVDDAVAADKQSSRVIKELASPGMVIHVYDVDRAVEKLSQDASFPGENVIVLTKTPTTFEQIVDRGINIKEINLGGMGIRGDRKRLLKRVACDSSEIESIKHLMEKGIHIYYQTIPGQSEEELDKYIKD